MEAEKSLSGAGVVVTRDEEAEGALTRLLVRLGAKVHHWGTIGVAAPLDPGPLEEALTRIRSFDWVCFSSPRAVQAVVTRVQEILGADGPGGVKIAAVGPSTASALEAAGWPVHRVPAQASGGGLVHAFRQAGDAKGARVLFPASAIARDEIPRGLADLGAAVEQVTAYRMVTLPLDRAACLAAMEAGEVDAVTFASPSAMEGLREALGDDLFRRLAENIPAATMGPTTSSALRVAGWRTIEEADAPTLPALAAAAARAAAASEKH